MTEIATKLPIELANNVYSFLGEHPVAKLIREDDENQNEFCCECEVYVADKDRFERNIYICSKTNKGLCEYCHAEELGIEVHSCDNCSCKTFEYLEYNNTEVGLFCNDCLAEQQAEEEDAENDE
jgi:hypothetical protein